MEAALMGILLALGAFAIIRYGTRWLRAEKEMRELRKAYRQMGDMIWRQVEPDLQRLIARLERLNRRER